MRTPPFRFAVCITNKGYEASLEIGKLYRVIPDDIAQRHGYLRIVDESGEDYGYTEDRFFAIDVPKPLERALLRAREAKISEIFACLVLDELLPTQREISDAGSCDFDDAIS